MARTPRTRSQVKDVKETPIRELARARSKAKEEPDEPKASRTKPSSKASRATKKGVKKGKTMSKARLEDDEVYTMLLTAVKDLVYTISSGHPSIKFDKNTPGIKTADFERDLNMDRSCLRELGISVSRYCFTTIEPGDGHDIKCIQDMAKYILYLQKAKRVEGLSPFPSTFDPSARENTKYKNRLAKVIEIVKLYSGKQGQINPRDDFEHDLVMSKEDVYLVFFHIRRDVAKKCPFDMVDAGYMCRIRCSQDAADLHAFYPTVDEDEDEQRFLQYYDP